MQGWSVSVERIDTMTTTIEQRIAMRRDYDYDYISSDTTLGTGLCDYIAAQADRLSLRL